MPKIILLFLFLLGFCLPGYAQVSVISVTDENKHSKKEDFYHTFEYFVIPDDHTQQPSKCQATRIHRRWFATAAHCLYKKCDAGCTIRMDLLEQPFSVLASVRHAPNAKPKRLNVFLHPGYNPLYTTKDDIALINLDLSRASVEYYRRPAKPGQPGVAVPKARFRQFLNGNKKAASQYAHVLSPDIPSIFIFDDMNYLLDRTISVISIFDGVREIKQDPYKVYYLKDLGFAYTPNFGVRKGMSGSGVMANTGELVGIISSSFVFSKPQAYAGESKAKKQLVDNFFLFTAFNKDLKNFMEETMGSDYYQLDLRDVYASWRDRSTDHSLILQTIGYANKQADKQTRAAAGK